MLRSTRRLRAAAFALVGSAAAACGPSSPAATIGPTVGTPPGSLAGTAEARRIVYASAPSYIAEEPGATDLWLYNVGGDRLDRLTRDGHARIERAPRFRDPRRITFVVGDQESAVLWELDLTDRRQRMVFSPAGSLDAYDWNADGTLAFVSTGAGDGRALSVLSNGATTRLLALGGEVGGEPYADDERSVAWSPDGSAILVVSTFSDAPGSRARFLAVDRAGRTVVPARAGTFARWSPDGRRVLYRGYDGAQAWFSLDVRSGKTSRLAVTAGTAYPAYSPDGSRIAFSGSGPDASVYVYDAASATERRIARGFAGPVWLSPGRVAVTDVGPCPVERCGEHPWMIEGPARAIDVATGEQRALTLGLTRSSHWNVPDADVLYG